MVTGLLLIILGLSLVFLASASRSRRKRDILLRAVLFALGFAYVLYGLRAEDPLPQAEVSLSELFSLMGGALAMGKAVTWAITRTDFYRSLVEALKSIPEIKESVRHIEKNVVGGG